MSFDTTTFVLEIVNFLVLMWLLKRFFYKPVQAAIAARQQKLQDAQQQAQMLEADAQALKLLYQQRLESWEVERSQKMQALEQELVTLREKALADIRVAADAEKARRDAVDEKEREVVSQQMQAVAKSHALDFLGRLLTSLASAALDQRMLALLGEDIGQAGLQRKAVADALAACNGAVIVQSAHVIDEASVAAFSGDLSALFSMPVLAKHEVRPELTGGVRVIIGPRCLDLNLAEELRYFRDRVMNGDF